MRLLDLFSGIGGFSLGLERAGFETVAFCEIDPVCRGLLAHHWPEVPCYDDITTLTAERLAADGISVDAICGGFPCQDLSFAGKGAGLAGERSGLWREYARLIRELRPRVVIVENVSALLGRGLGDVLGDLSEIGYDVVWDCIPASAVGAPHRRDRLWIVAYARSEQHEGCGPAIWRALAAQLSGSVVADATQFPEREPADQADAIATGGQAWLESWGGCNDGRDQRLPAGHDPEAQPLNPDPDCIGSHRAGMHIDRGAELRDEQECDPGSVGADVADAERGGLEGWRIGLAAPTAEFASALCGERGARERPGHRPAQPPMGRMVDGIPPRLDRTHEGWEAEPEDTPRVATGVPARAARLKGLGNAVVPQIPELIGRAIMEAIA